MLEILRELNKSDLLNQVGRILAEQPELFPETFYEMQRFFEGMGEEKILEQLVTSSLVGADDKLAIEDWIAEDEQETMYQIIDEDVENDVKMYKTHDGEWISENGRWSVIKGGIYRNIGVSSELVGDMENVPDTVQRLYDQLQDGKSK